MLSNLGLPASLETPPRFFHPETREGSGSTLVLATHKSDRYDWQGIIYNTIHNDPLQNKLEWATAQWAAWVQTLIQYCTTTYPASRKSVQERVKEEDIRSGFPCCG